MAALTTKDKMVERFGESILVDLTDRSNPRTGQISDVILDAAIVSASDFVISYIRERYDVSEIEADAPPPIPQFVEDLTLWFLSKDPVEWVTEKYKAALQWLNLVRKGDVLLGLNSTGEETAAKLSVDYVAPNRELTTTTLHSFFGRSDNGGTRF